MGRRLAGNEAAIVEVGFSVGAGLNEAWAVVLVGEEVEVEVE